MVFLSCELNHLLEILDCMFQPYFEVQNLTKSSETMYQLLVVISVSLEADFQKAAYFV